MTRWVVVGGGSAGSVIAARLSERPDDEVVVLESGGERGSERLPAGEPVLDRPTFVRHVDLTRRPLGPVEPYVQGCGLGGSSLVNGAVAIGDPGRLAIGHDLPIEPPVDVGVVATAVEKISSAARRVHMFTRDGGRVTAADVYLAPASDRGNLTIRRGTSVARVVFDGRRAVGVATESGAHIAADRVVLCAGAVESPALLLRSGVDTAGVGEGLTDHVGVTISFDLRSPASRDAPAIGVTVERPGRQIVVIDRLPGNDAMGAVLCGHLAVTSVGSVSLPERDGPPVVLTNQLADSADRAGLALAFAEGTALARRLQADGVVGDCYVDDVGTRLEDASLAHLGLGGYHHLAASCRVGAALAGDGTLRGYEGVYVCDASSLPALPTRNLYLAVVRHAERTVARWRRER